VVERTSSGREFHPLKASAFHGALLRQPLLMRSASAIENERQAAADNKNNGSNPYS
jgi:hypothetical protein